MKKIFFILIFISAFGFSQTHRFIYEVKYKKDSTENLITKENYYLDINSDETLYYARPYFVSDSIYKKTGEMMAVIGKLTDILSKDKKRNEYSSYVFRGFDLFRLKDKLMQNWKIESEIKTENNLKLQKATAKFGGRNWIAWFAPEIPFNEGPYKFSGLPGLIVELADDKENYHFGLLKSENLKETYVIDFYTRAKERAVEIPYSKFQKIELVYFKSPMKAARDGMIDISKSPIITEYGTKISNEKELREYEESERKLLIKYNNPIELDKAIKYPLK